MSSKAALGLLCLASLACGSRGAVPVLGDFHVLIGTPPVLLLDQAHPVPDGNADRQRRLLDLFAEAGCGDVDRRWRDPSELPHVVCTLRGASDATILVTANFDQPLGRGATSVSVRGRSGAQTHSSRPDNWLGAAMLPSLYLSLGVAPRLHSYTFIAFADEARGRAGNPTASLRMLERLPHSERRSVVALVSLKSLHLDVPAVWEAVADPELHLDLYSVSRSLELPIRRVDFRVRRNNPVIYNGHGMPGSLGTQDVPIRLPRSEVPSILIGVADLQVGEYLDSFRLVAAYLSYLDQTIELRRRMRDDAETAERTALSEPPG